MYRRYLEGVEIIPSIIRKGNCYDNAYVKSFFSTLKNECISRIKTKIYTLVDAVNDEQEYKNKMMRNLKKLI